jgi:hypothetical protein
VIELGVLTRPAEDVLSRVVRITLGGTEYQLPVRSIRANRDWKERLDSTTTGLLTALDVSEDDLAAIYAALASQTDSLIDLLLSYDNSGVLPTRDELEAIEPDVSLDVLAAVREVWRAANPLVAKSLELISSQAYGWGPTTIREELSDEQLVAYFDAAAERLRAEREAEFDSRVEAARLGTIFAHDAKTYQRWHRRNAATEGRRRPADDQVIEHQIMQLASMFPGAVSFGTMPGGAG